MKRGPRGTSGRIPALHPDMNGSFETLHPRDRAGKFSAHIGAEQQGTLTEDPGGDSPPGTPECTSPECSRIDGRCVGMHCPTCGQPCSSMGHQRCGTPATAAGPGAAPAQAKNAYGDPAVGDEPRPVTNLTAIESRTLRKLPLSRLVSVSRRLGAGPGDDYRETGPEQRLEIARQIGGGNLMAISGGRVIPLPDGIELPVSNGYSVQVRLAGDDTYTVRRVFTRAGKETVKGERTGVYAEQVSQAAYYASCFRSHSADEWAIAG